MNRVFDQNYASPLELQVHNLLLEIRKLPASVQGMYCQVLAQDLLETITRTTPPYRVANKGECWECGAWTSNRSYRWAGLHFRCSSHQD